MSRRIENPSREVLSMRERRRKWGKLWDAKFSHKDFEDVRKAYRENFKMLMASLGTPEHEKYVKEEIRLNHLDRIVGRAVKIYQNEEVRRGRVYVK